MRSPLATYLRALGRQLWWRGLFSTEVLEEVESHLQEAVEAGLRDGLSPAAAECRALERFGPASVVAAAFNKERNTPMQKLLLGLAALAGLFSVYVDSRPSWDDTGILAFGLVAASGLVTLLGYRRPWLSALAVGLWIPAYELYRSHDVRMLIILLFPLVGAYLGWLVHQGFRKTFHPA